jgi:hypothetical protein
LQGLNLLSPKSKAELDYRTLNNDNITGTSPDQFKTGHFKMEKCPSEIKVWSARKTTFGKRFQTPNAADTIKYATIFEKF